MSEEGWGGGRGEGRTCGSREKGGWFNEIKLPSEPPKCR